MKINGAAMNPSAFLSACVAQKGRDVPVFSVASSPQNDGTTFFAKPGAEWIRYSVEVDWNAIAMASIQYPGTADILVFAFGTQGQYWELEPGRSAQRTGLLPTDISDVTNATTALDAVWICGMDRIVWRRDSVGTWHDHSAPSGIDGEGVVGFTALAQSSPKSLVAVGWRGEIWWFDGYEWERQDSGCNANLNSVATSPTGEVIAVGDRGAIVQGTSGRWQAFSTPAAFNLQDVCVFDGEVFVCSDFEIFLWRDGELMLDDRFATLERPGSCMKLKAGKHSLFSIGEGDIFRFHQGRWSKFI